MVTHCHIFANGTDLTRRKTVRRPYDYIISLKGKDFRRQVLLALNVWLQVNVETYDIIDHVVSILHNSSLL
jgi:geranylgeranyl diphosphate synthase type 3